MTTRQWLVATNGTYDFNNPADWQFGAVPSAIDIAQFSTGVVDTITGNATIAGIVVGSGNFALAGTYAISGTQPTELTVNGSLTILPGASVIGNQAVSVSGGSAFLSVQGTLVAGSLSIVGGALDVYQGASFDVSGPITIGNFGGLTGLPAPNQNARSAVAIDNAIQTSGTIFLGSLGQQEIDFNGIISGSGLVNLNGAGEVALNGNNTYSGGTTINPFGPNFTVAAGNANAFGTGALTLNGGELLATTTETIGNQLTMSGNFTIAAAHGQTVTTSSSSRWTLTTSQGQMINFGAAGQDGTVVFMATGGGSVTNAGTYTVNVQAGTLKAGDFGLGFLLGNALATVVQSGATLDAAGVSLAVGGLQGGGHIGNSGAATTLDLANSNFAGTIDGPLTLLVFLISTLSGANTYTGGTAINNGAVLTLGNGGATGSVAGNISDSGTLAINRSDTFTLNNVSGSGGVSQIGSGTMLLGNGLSYTGGTTIAAGTLSVGNASALGSGGLTINGGELLATTTETINNQMTMSGNFTIAAAHGQTLTTSGLSPWTLNAAPGEMINFGAAGQDGTVVFKFAAGTAINGINTYTVNVQAGTLKAGDGGLSFLLGNALATVVQSGATLDVAGFSPAVNGLQGGGHVGNSGGATTLNVFNGNFAGTIDGPLTLRVFGGLTLTGANTYTGGTTISSGTLTLGNGGATGSVAGNIADFGTLAINHSDMFTLNNVSGTGVVSQIGSGTTILGSGLSYSGGTSIAAGILSVGNAGALGSGALTINGGELLATTTETIGNQLTMSGNFTIAAAHGQTLTTFGASPWVLNASPGEMINFGAAGQDGTVVFKSGGASAITQAGTDTVNVQAGTLKAGDTSVGFLLGNDLATVVQSGATLDAAGFTLFVDALQGGGHVGNSGAAATLNVINGNFAGTIDGSLALRVFGGLTLSGANTYTGGTTIVSGTLTLGNGGASGSVAGDIADNGTLEFHLGSTTIEGGVISGSGSLVQDGPGTTVLTRTNSYSGGTFIGGGTLELQRSDSAGTGAITFLSGAAATLRIDGTTMPSNLIDGFTPIDTFDLANVAFASGATATVSAANVLHISENGSTYSLQLNPAENFSTASFFVGSDGNGGSFIGELPPAVTATNQVVGYNQSVPLSNIFTVAGSGVTQYQIWFSYPEGGDPADGQVTDNGAPIATDQWVTVSSLSGISYVGGANAGADHLWLRAYNGLWGSAAQAVLTDPGTTPDTITAHNMSVADNQAAALASIFSVTGPAPTDYQVWLAGSADGSVTDANGAIATSTAVDETSLSGVNYIGSATPGSDLLYLRAFDGQWSNWVLATLTDPGATPDMISATNQSVAYNQSVALASIFSVTGPAPTDYQVWLAGPADGSVTDGHGAIATSTAVDETSLSVINYLGGAAPRSDLLYLRAFDGQWSNWVQAVLTDPGVTPDTIVGTNQSVAYNQVVGLSSLFAVTGPTPSQYQLWLTGAADGAVTDSHGAIATSTAVNETSLSGVNYIGGAAPGSDTLYVRSFDGQWSSWVQATLTDPGVAPDTITGHGLSIAENQSVALSSIFSVTGPTPSEYQLWLTSPADGAVTDGIGAIATGTAVNESSLNGINFIGGGAPGTDALYLRSFDGQWSGWVRSTVQTS